MKITRNHNNEQPAATAAPPVRRTRKSNPENRIKTRFEHESSITLENNEIGLQRGARMYNYSDFGLYFEADIALQLQTEIRIGISNSPFAPEPDQYEKFRGIIKWRRELKHSAYYYGYGVKLFGEISEQGESEPSVTSRRHPRKTCSIPLKYVYDNMVFHATTENVSRGGVFVKTRDIVPVGQQISVEIPPSKKGKIARLRGKVTRTNPKGFGVQFLPAK